MVGHSSVGLDRPARPDSTARQSRLGRSVAAQTLTAPLKWKCRSVHFSPPPAAREGALCRHHRGEVLPQGMTAATDRAGEINLPGPLALLPWPEGPPDLAAG